MTEDRADQAIKGGYWFTLEEIADQIAKDLDIDPESVGISPSRGEVILTAEQAEKLLLRIER